MRAFTSMLEAGASSSSPLAVIVTVMTSIVLVLGIIGALKGLSRGISRQVVRTITIIVSAVASFIVAKSLYSVIGNFFEGKTMADVGQYLVQWGVFPSETDLSWLSSMDTKTAELIVMLPVSILVVPLLFVIAFILISGVMLIVHGILSNIFGFKKRRNNFITRILGMALGLVQGVVVAALIMTPVIGILSSVSDSVDTIKTEAPDSEVTANLVEVYDANLKEVAEAPVVKVFGTVGIKSLYSGLATFEIDGKKNDMSQLFPDLTKVACSAIALGDVDLMNITPENEETINNFISNIEKNDYLTSVLAGAIQFGSHLVTSDSVNIEMEEPINSFVISAMEIFHTTDSTNVITDLNTVKDVLFILSREGVFASFESGSDAMLNAFTVRDAQGKTVINKVIDTINSNERMKSLVTLMTKLSVSVMTGQLGLDAENAELYDNVKNGINENILSINKNDYATKDEYVGAVSSALDTTLKENNIELEPSVVDNMAQYIADNYSDKTEVTDEEINDIILSYYDAYLDSQGN